LSKNLPSDTFKFENENIHNAFNLALEKGDMFLEENPESNYIITVDGKLKKIILNYEYVSVKRHYASLFGPGSVPGLLSEEDMATIASLSARLPKSGNFVEIGTFLGKSAVEWAKNLQKQNKDFNIICIDSFNSPIEILKELLAEAAFDIPEGVTQLELFKYYTEKGTNIRSYPIYFDHKIADSYSSFPLIYSYGIVANEKNKLIINDCRKKSIALKTKFKELDRIVFIENCIQNDTYFDINKPNCPLQPYKQNFIKSYSLMLFDSS
jgi:hypothetical protein